MRQDAIIFLQQLRIGLTNVWMQMYQSQVTCVQKQETLCTGTLE